MVDGSGGCVWDGGCCGAGPYESWDCVQDDGPSVWDWALTRGVEVG
jgi:hypothetical protein